MSLSLLSEEKMGEKMESEIETALKKEGFNIFIPGKELSQFITILHCAHPHIFLSHYAVLRVAGKKQ